MGKGFNNYMCKKFFHPSSRENLKRVWMAEQQADSYKKKQEELRQQYEKEQDLYTNKSIVSKESKEKLSVNFLYEPPPGTKKEREREDDEPEYKFEWQRKYNAPRESYCKGDQEIRDQPFGIQVRNVRCIKCHKWGHINTDKECPMYNQSGSASGSGPSLDPSELIRQMRDDGLAMKKGAVGLLELNPTSHGNQQLLSSSSEDEDHIKESEIKFLKGLSTKQKMKLLKKLEKLEKKKKHKKEKEKRKKKKKSKKGNDHKTASESGTESESDSDKVKLKSDADKSKISKKIKKEKRSKQSSDGEWVEVKKERESDNEMNTFQVLGRHMDFEGPSTKNHSKEHFDKKCFSGDKSYWSKSQNGGKTVGFHEVEHHRRHSRSKSPRDSRRGHLSESQSPRRENRKRYVRNGHGDHEKLSKRRSRSRSYDGESRKRNRRSRSP